MQKSDRWQNSECIGNYLHRFSIQEQYEQGVMEVCEICGKSMFFRIIDGKVNNAQYMSYHLRQALPRDDEYYYHEYEYNPLTDSIISPYVR